MRNDEFSRLVLKIDYIAFSQHLVCARLSDRDTQGKIPLLRSLHSRRERRNKKKKKIKRKVREAATDGCNPGAVWLRHCGQSAP